LRGIAASLEAATSIGNWIVNEYAPLKEKGLSFIQGRTNGGFTNVVIIGQMTRLYRHTGNNECLDFVRQVIDVFPPIQQMLSTGEPYLFHPYMLCAVLMGLAEYAGLTKDYKMLTKVEQVWDRLANTYMFPTGSLGEKEDLDDKPIKDVSDGQLQETCATTEWIFFTMKLYEITGRNKYIEALEKTCYNALIGAQSVDGMKWCYWMPLRYSKHFLHGPTRCCFWSGPRGVARIPQIIYATRGNTVYVNVFESSKATLTTTTGELSVIQVSDFPESGNSRVSIKTPDGWEGTLNIRVPGWTESFKAKLNGSLVKNSIGEEGYLSMILKDSDEYEVELQFGIQFSLKELEKDNCVMCRGPEVLSLDTRDNIDTWLGAQDDLITIPEGICILPLENGGPVSGERRRYLVKVNDARTDELRAVVLTPYADAGNEGAAFRTVFPLAKLENWQETKQ
jgi:hypothetical protein